MAKATRGKVPRAADTGRWPHRHAAGGRLADRFTGGEATGHSIMILAATLVVYVNTFHNAFVWDDLFLIINNPAIKSWWNLPALFWSDLFPRGIVSHYYRPLQALSYLVDYQLWGLAPLGYHVTNTLLHVGVAWLFYRLASLLLGEARSAVMAALLFAVHPIHTEAVTYMSGRSDPLSAFFMLASLLGFLQSRQAKFTKWRWLSLATFFLALLAREAALSLVLLVIWVDVAVSLREGERLQTGWRDRLLYRYAPYLGVLVGYLALRAAAVSLAPAPTPIIAQVALPLRLLTMLKVVVEYLTLLVVPLNQHMERLVAPAESGLEPAVAGSALLVGGLLAAAVACLKTAWPVAFGVGWFFLALLPVSNLVPLATFMAEHWLYVPSMGLFLAVGWGLGQLMDRGWQQPVATGLVVALAAYGGLTIRRNLDWRDEPTLYQATLALAPHSARAYTNVGVTYHNRGQLEEAAAAYQHALQLSRSSGESAHTYVLLGKIDQQQKRYEEALAKLRQALALDPTQVRAYNEMGLTLSAMGKGDEAKEAFATALRLNPDYAEAHNNLGNYYFRQGELEEARAKYLTALRLDPDYAKAHNNLGSVHFQLGELDLAEAEYRQALRIDPSLEEVRRNLEVVIRSRSGGLEPQSDSAESSSPPPSQPSP